MHNYKEHIKDINKDFVSSVYAMYIDDEYGIQVGYTPVPLYTASMNRQLAEWQLKSDCCSQCTASTQPIAGTILQYCALPATPNPCSPFQPLFSGGSFKPCNV